MIRKMAISIDASGDLVEKGPDGAPIAFRIWKGGKNDDDQGGTFFTKESADLLMAEQNSRGRLYSIDFDHLSLSENRPAESGRAAGWHSLAMRGEELWAVDVLWCADVKAGLTEDPPRWRYFSPAFRTDKAGVVRSYINLALCINPLTHGLPSLASIQDNNNKKENTNMDPKEALKALLAGADCGEDVKAAITKAFLETEEPKEEEKKAEEAPEEKKEEPEIKANSALADTSANLAVELAKRDRKIEELEIAQLLSARADLAPSIVELCKSPEFGVVQVRAMLKKIPATTAKREAAPTAGESVKTEKPMDRDEEIALQEMRRAFGLVKEEYRAPFKDEHGRFIVPLATPTQIRMNAAKKGA